MYTNVLSGIPWAATAAAVPQTRNPAAGHPRTSRSARLALSTIGDASTTSCKCTVYCIVWLRNMRREKEPETKRERGPAASPTHDPTLAHAVATHTPTHVRIYQHLSSSSQRVGMYRILHSLQSLVIILVQCLPVVLHSEYKRGKSGHAVRR